MLVLVKKSMIKRMESKMMIDVPVIGHYVRCAEGEKRVTFQINFTRPYPTRMRITQIDYVISHNSRIIQRGQWHDGAILDVKNIRTTISLFYNPLESPTGMPDSGNNWKISGIATIETIYGEFKSPFESTRLEINSQTDWAILRKEVKDATS
jgi:hypothetical protein